MKDYAGFTLIELLVGFAVLSVLISLAAPNFKATISDARQVTAYNKVSSTLRFARSEAIKRSSAVSVCGRNSDTSCSNDWSNGMLVFEDSASDGSALTYDGSDSTLRSVLLPGNGINLKASAMLTSSASSATATSVIRFDGRGRPNWRNGTLVLCDGRGASHAKALIMTGSGVGRRAYSTDSSNGVVVDSRGTAVSCL